MLSTLHQISERLFPSWLYRRLVSDWDRNGLKKYLKNTGWMFFGRIASFLISFLTITFVARYLGPENLGKLSYAQSFVAIFSMFASLGVDQIVYRELVAKPDKEGEILGTAIAIKLVFGVITLIATTVTAFLINTEPLLTWLIAIISLSFIFQPLGTVGHVFSARVLSKYPSLVGVGIAIIVPILKLIVIFFDKGILYFAAIIAAEALLLSAAYIVLYITVLRKTIFDWQVQRSMFFALIRDSWPLMLVGVTGYLYGRIDQVMIQHFIDSTSVGLYEAAVRLTDPLGFIPGIIVGSLFPALINARKNDPAEYRRRLRSLAMLCIGISSSLALILFIAAPYLISLLYGPAFLDSVVILRIYVWSTVGTVATGLMYNYFIAENRSHIQLLYTFGGAVLNILLNLALIPLYGSIGAAYATLITVGTIVAAFLLTHRSK